MLADVNVQGHMLYLRRLLESVGLWSVLAQVSLELATFAELGLPPNLDDRALWNFCQDQGWVLFTENRNHDGPDSLDATIADSWQDGQLPVVTLANKGHFERDRAYAEGVAIDIAELLFGIESNDYRDQPRIYVPLGR
jgi:hypothetical protein